MAYLSVHYVSSEVWNVMKQVTKTTTEIGLFLLHGLLMTDFTFVDPKNKREYVQNNR